MRSNTKKYVICGLCIAIICVLAPIAIPIGPVPISLATFAVMFAGFLLGAKWGTVATVLYIIIGAIGVPVFAGYTAGFARIAGPTGGYIIGYIALALICGLIKNKFADNKTGPKKYVIMAIAAILGTIALYALGTAWFCIESNTNVIPALGMCVIPFLPGDAIKCAVVIALVPMLEKSLARAHVIIKDTK